MIFCSDMVSLLLLWLKFIHHGVIEGCREGGGKTISSLTAISAVVAVLFCERYSGITVLTLFSFYNNSHFHICMRVKFMGIRC